MQEILINIEAGERRVAILHSKKLEWYFVERMNQKRIVGNIYKGKVTSVLNGIGAAFVDCGLEKNGFLYISDTTASVPGEEYSDLLLNGATEGEDHNGRSLPSEMKISDIVKPGQDLLVQAVKEGIGTKGARITTHISLPGRHLVLMPSSSRIGVSRRIRDEDERRRIKTILHELELPKSIGLVARTAAEGCSKKDFLRDIRYLLDTYNRIKKLTKTETAPSLLFEELNLSSKVIRDYLTAETENVIVDDKAEHRRLRYFVSRIAPKLRNRVRLYKGDEPLFEKYGIEKEIDKLFERKIFLRCGGYITIEQTEGMIAIDVNSGRFTGKKHLEDTVFKVNSEAAEEVARQLRLRDIGGIIIIDFIDMESKAHRKEVFSLLQKALKKDRAKTDIVSLSELDVVEMTRQRVRRSLESVSYQNCPYCEGRGRVKSSVTISIIAQRKLRVFLRSHRHRRHPIEVVVHPLVAQRLVNEDASSLDLLRKKFRRHIAVVADDSQHIDQVKIIPAK